MDSEDSHQKYSRRRLRVLADADPGTIARVVERFQNLNIIPRRLIAEFASNDILHIEVDVCGLPDEQLALIAGKIRPGVSTEELDAAAERFIRSQGATPTLRPQAHPETPDAQRRRPRRR